MAPQTASARQNLPLESTGFIGRERDLSDLLRLLDSDRLITLCGVNGIGKTRMALRVAAQANTSFPDGVWLVELADTATRNEIITRIARAVGVVEEASRDPAETLFDALRGRHLLLVLDGCDTVISEVAALGRMLLDACPSVRLLLTSREPARIGGETVWRVPPLSPPSRRGERTLADSEAVRLFVERSQKSDSPVSPRRLRTIADICRRLDGIPLCIELVAAWARFHSLDEIAGLLGDHFPPSTGEDHGVASRQRIVDAVLDWSSSLLTEAERTLLRRLSVFTDWDLELAERVCPDDRLPETEILDAASVLVDRFLVTLTGEYQGRVRYRLPQAVRRYATARLSESGEEEAVRTRHREQMLHLAERFGRVTVLGRAMPWAERHGVWHCVAADYGNLRSALHWSAERGDTEAGLRLCVGLRPFWISDRSLFEGCQWIDLFLRLEGGDALRGRAMVQRAELAWMRSDLRLSRESAEKGMQRCRVAGETESVLLALNLLAVIDIRDCDHECARERLAEVLRLARESGDLWNEAFALATQGAFTARQGDFPGAGVFYSTALLILRGMDHRAGVGHTLIGHAIAAEMHNDLDVADRCYREALDIQRDIGLTPELARCLAGVGRVAHAQGATAQSYDHLSESLLLSHSTGQRAGVARALTSIARIAAKDGFIEGACRLAGAASTIRGSAGLPASPSPWPLQDARFDFAQDTLWSWWSQGRTLGLDEAVATALRITEAGRVPRPRTAPAPVAAPPEETLTRRECEVARLIGEGRSNRGIADTLFISQATVARHVANINRKTGFSSRKQIAAWVNERHDGQSVPP